MNKSFDIVECVKDEIYLQKYNLQYSGMCKSKLNVWGAQICAPDILTSSEFRFRIYHKVVVNAKKFHAIRALSA